MKSLVTEEKAAAVVSGSRLALIRSASYQLSAPPDPGVWTHLDCRTGGPRTCSPETGLSSAETVQNPVLLRA